MPDPASWTDWHLVDWLLNVSEWQRLEIRPLGCGEHLARISGRSDGLEGLHSPAAVF
jgi:hypothetical protein